MVLIGVSSEVSVGVWDHGRAKHHSRSRFVVSHGLEPKTENGIGGLRLRRALSGVKKDADSTDRVTGVRTCLQGVRGSNPLGSTKRPRNP